MPPISKDTLLRYCLTIYEALEAASKEVDGVRQWEGRYTELFAGLGISNAHYSKVSNTLQEIGAIEILRRGARGTSTIIALHRKPEVSDLPGGVGSDSASLTRPSALDTLTQRVSQLERRLDGIDVKAYITSTERRLLALEGKQAKKPRERRSA